ncbi:MAG: MBL fold metallo-hydrolase [Planctomycetota bacterium]|nr:MBL fold metallo-hydrolase [Planctomycetota bacterium]
MKIRYWGVTGSYPRAAEPAEFTERVAQAIVALQRAGTLQSINDRLPNAAEVATLVKQNLPPQQHAALGGQTTCIEVQTPVSLIILYAGTGLSDLGRDLECRWSAADYSGQRVAHLLLSHAHMDHVQGLPFAMPLYDPANHVTLHALQPVLDGLAALMNEHSTLQGILFPTTTTMLAGIKQYQPIQPGKQFVIGATTIDSLHLHHPTACVAYRLTSGGKKFVFATDFEQTVPPDPKLIEFCRDADLLYADAQFLQSEYDGQTPVRDERPVSRAGWGHSTVEATVELAVAACVRRLHLGHHDPRRTDAGLYDLERHAKTLAIRLLKSQNLPAKLLQVELARQAESGVL